jgi:tellurite resistance protein TerC
MDKFQYIKYSLVAVLLFVGIKMMLVQFYHISPVVSLLVIVGSLLAGVFYSMYKLKQQPTQTH